MSEAQLVAVARLAEKLDAIGGVFDDARKRRTLAELERRSHAEDFWHDADAAQRVMKQLADLRSDTDAIDAVARRLDEARETLEVLGDEPGAAVEADGLIAQAEQRLDVLEMAATFDREYDHHGAIVTIHAGAGGIDAADWTQMLARMYLRWAEGRGFSTQVAEESPADEAGLKSVTFFVHGKDAYGMLESERGVHRLVRISPFDQQHRRHTSFASVDIVPEIESDEKIDVEVRPEDLKIETFKAGGAGGQYVNKTESAIRITHLPSGVIVASQQERSQIQNREVAMNILRAKLVQRELEEREAKLAELRGDRRANEWGSQIRSYVLQPYTLVKDHRTNAETGNAQAVLEGEIETFIWPYLQARPRLAESTR
ncbi:MAG: peptide chain release factor 2 [Candidatus Baltobacteraceae bacterium]